MIYYTYRKESQDVIYRITMRLLGYSYKTVPSDVHACGLSEKEKGAPY